MATENAEMVQQTPNKPEPVSDRPRIAPPVDVYENADELLLVADVPGVHQDGLEIRLDGGELLIEAQQAEQAELEGYEPRLFTRTFTVPSTIAADRVEAELSAGVLRVRLPKSEAAKPRRIAIKSG